MRPGFEGIGHVAASVITDDRRELAVQRRDETVSRPVEVFRLASDEPSDHLRIVS